jgi:hypothetical protein
MRFLALLLACVFISSAAAQDETTAPERPDFSVLTPSMEGQFFVATQFNLNAIYPLLGAPADAMNQSRTSQLRRLVAVNRYDPARALADRLIEALGEAGFRAVYEPIPRRPAGSIQSLSWSDLPEQPQGELFLDVNVRWICLCSSSSYTKIYPSISLGWRLLDPRQSVAEPTRNLVYYHIPWDPPDRTSDRDKARLAAESPYPKVEVSESCGYKSLEDAKENPAQLWGCFGEAFDAAVTRLVIDLEKIRPPRATVTASGDTPSGTSR